MKALFITLVVLLLGSVNLHCQYIERNSNFSITFPEKPEQVKYPGQDDGFMLVYTSSKEQYTIQVICITVPPKDRENPSNIDLTGISKLSFESYLRAAGGGTLIKQEMTKIQNHRASVGSFKLDNVYRVYNYSKMLFSYTGEYMYIIAFYYNNTPSTFNNYVNSFKIFK